MSVRVFFFIVAMPMLGVAVRMATMTTMATRVMPVRGTLMLMQLARPIFPIKLMALTGNPGNHYRNRRHRQISKFHHRDSILPPYSMQASESF